MASNTKKYHLLAEEKFLKISENYKKNFPTVYNISQFYEIQRQKSSPALNGLSDKTLRNIKTLAISPLKENKI